MDGGELRLQGTPWVVARQGEKAPVRPATFERSGFLRADFAGGFRCVSRSTVVSEDIGSRIRERPTGDRLRKILCVLVLGEGRLWDDAVDRATGGFEQRSNIATVFAIVNID